MNLVDSIAKAIRAFLRGFFGQVLSAQGYRKLTHEDQENTAKKYRVDLEKSPWRKHVPIYGVTERQAEMYYNFCVDQKRLPVLLKVRESCEHLGSPLILDAGSGIGDIALMAAQMMPKATVYGVELSKTALKIARERYNKDNIVYYAGDVTKMHFDDNLFDVVYSRTVLEHVNNPRKMIRECLRVLKPKGFFICCAPPGNIVNFGNFLFLKCG